MMSTFKHVLGGNLKNAVGWRTNRKIIVFESDDWGSIRMPSKECNNTLRSKGINFLNKFETLDTLASQDDLNALFEVLLKYKDKNGRHPIITANTVVANPDFEKIKHSDFSEYHYEIFTETLKRYYPNKNVFALWEEGMSEHIFFPQFHGREHINVSMWLDSLKDNIFGMRDAFNCRTWLTSIDSDIRKFIVRSYDYKDFEEERFVINSISEGLDIFQKIFAYNSKSFMAPAYCWSDSIETILKLKGVEFIQSGPYQYFPLKVSQENGKKKERHYIGQKSSKSQIYTFRNVTFEPSLTVDGDVAVNESLDEIKRAFRWKKPAIISTHRLNFIGSLEESNRTKNLGMFNKLLSQITKHFPDVEFMNSAQLGNLIKFDKR